MKLQWNWGTKIVLAYAIFIVLILTAVFKALNQKVDLVTPDYYAQELAYQDKQKKMENANAISPVNIMQQSSNVVITFPKETQGVLTGKVLFYRAANSADDVTLIIKADSNNKMLVPVAKLKKGSYTVITDWVAGGNKYYNKTDIFIQ